MFSCYKRPCGCRSPLTLPDSTQSVNDLPAGQRKYLYMKMYDTLRGVYKILWVTDRKGT